MTALDPWYSHRLGHKPFVVLGVELAPCDCHDHRIRAIGELIGEGLAFLSLVAVLFLYLFAFAPGVGS